MTSYTTRNKASRLAQIAAILLTAPDGMTQAELARRLGVNRSTVNRYIPDLPGFIYIDELDGGKWKLDRPALEFNIRLNLDEAMAIHLATRLLSTRMERQNPHSASALRKLSVALEKISPQISGHLRKTANGIDDPARKQDPGFLKAIETLTQAWATYHKVMIHYQAENDVPKAYLFSPYFIEPYAIGQSTYVIGWRDPPGALRTFKVERITDIALCGETYSIPPGFDPEQFLKDAWGIWYTEEAPPHPASPADGRGAERRGG
jgi:CRISPR-associated endonuclease/helicase Cas3